MKFLHEALLTNNGKATNTTTLNTIIN